MIRNSVLFGGLGKVSDGKEKGDDSVDASAEAGQQPQQRRRSSIKMHVFISSVRKLCDSVQQQARQTAAAATGTTRSRSGSKSDIARSKSTENLVATSDEADVCDSKSVYSVS